MLRDVQRPRSAAPGEREVHHLDAGIERSFLKPPGLIGIGFEGKVEQLAAKTFP